jgi:RNA polymerase sigma-54 factor
LGDLAKNRDSKWARDLGLDDAALAQARLVIAALEPVPGRPFGGEPNPSITVDAVVGKDTRGEWQHSLKDDYIPRLGISRYYKKMMKQAKGDDKAETREYLQEKYQSALWLMKGIEQRKRTLRRVLEVIVEVQAGFLEQGPAAFKPLALKDVASATGLHESTVSRVTTNKYVQTPRGVYELKYFFSGGLKTSAGGEDESSMAVKEKIRDLVSEENPAAPLSDQAISNSLQRGGVRIARRTVTKYREELKILPTHQRRQRVSSPSS